MVIVPVAVFGRSAASSASTFHTSGRFRRIHELPMFGSLGCIEVVVFLAVIPLGFNMNTGINLVLRWFAGDMVTVIATATSTTTASPARTTAPKGRDASAGCPRVLVGG